MPRTFIVAIVSYESCGGGHGESDAVECGLGAIIESKKNPIKFTVETLEIATPSEDEGLADAIRRIVEDYVTDMEE